MLRKSGVASTSKLPKSRSKKSSSSSLPKVSRSQSKSVKSDDGSKSSTERTHAKTQKSDTAPWTTPKLNKDKCGKTSKPKTLKKTTSAKSEESAQPKRKLLDPRPSIVVPDNIAAHFGSFYNTGDKQEFDLKAGGTKPKSQFTRQMLHTLEQTAGTSEYARKLSVLLEETLEPPNFRINQPPAESTIPYGKEGPAGYPRWYKEPHKMPITAMEEYLKLMEEFSNMDYDSAVNKTLELYEPESDSEEEESKKSIADSTTSEETTVEPSSKTSYKNEKSESGRSSSSSEENTESEYTSTSSGNESDDEIEDNFETAKVYASTLTKPLFQNKLPSPDKVVST